MDLPDPTENGDAELVIYRGLASLEHVDGETQRRERLVEVVFGWRPFPRIDVRYEHDSQVEQFHELHGPPEWQPVAALDEWADAPVAPDDQQRNWSTPQLSSFRIGDVDGSVDAVHAEILNLTTALSSPIPRDGRYRVEVDGWRVELREVDNADTVDEFLKSTRRYARTHALTVDRENGDTFTYAEVDDFLGSLWLALSSMNGALIGIVAPTGYASGHAVWRDCSITSCDTAGYQLTWSDRHHFLSQMAEFLPSFHHARSDEFLAEVLKRIVRIAVASNQPAVLESSVVVAQTGIEILGWAILVQREQWLAADADLDAAGRIRLLLKWAGVDPALPPGLEELHKIKPSGSALWDGPQAVVWIRNRLTHPPKKAAEWPPGVAVEQAWRLSLTYLELATLRSVGYTGTYATRLDLEGRWVGSVEPVPWAPESA